MDAGISKWERSTPRTRFLKLQRLVHLAIVIKMKNVDPYGGCAHGSHFLHPFMSNNFYFSPCIIQHYVIALNKFQNFILSFDIST